jgi:hypothetical protein
MSQFQVRLRGVLIPPLFAVLALITMFETVGWIQGAWQSTEDTLLNYFGFRAFLYLAWGAGVFGLLALVAAWIERGRCGAGARLSHFALRWVVALAIGLGAVALAIDVEIGRIAFVPSALLTAAALGGLSGWLQWVLGRVDHQDQ